MNNVRSRPFIRVPADTVRITSAFLRSMPRLEDCCFWLGPHEPDNSATVEAIVVPPQENMPRNYHVQPEAMMRIADIARAKGWKHLAQIHSHPGTSVRHSRYDDEMANSRRALSLIYPNYGLGQGLWRLRGWLSPLWPRPFPRDVGVHAFNDGAWTFLDRAGVADALQLVAGPKPSFIDLRHDK